MISRFWTREVERSERPFETQKVERRHYETRHSRPHDQENIRPKRRSAEQRNLEYLMMIEARKEAEEAQKEALASKLRNQMKETRQRQENRKELRTLAKAELEGIREQKLENSGKKEAFYPPEVTTAHERPDEGVSKGGENRQEGALKRMRSRSLRRRINVRAAEEMLEESQRRSMKDTLSAYQEGMNRSDILDLPKKLCTISLRDLVYPLQVEKGRHIYVMNLTGLQQLNLQALRKDLAAQTSGILDSKSMSNEDSSRIKNLMADYCNALRDLDYMHDKHSRTIELDPFKLVSSQMRDAYILEDAKFSSYISTQWGPEYNPNNRQKISDDFHDPNLIGGSRAGSKEKKEAELFVTRFWFGLIGGLALIGPMLLMVLVKNRVTSLTTASVSTVLFALCMARFCDQPPLALVGTTAAYAAVLVVFVGSSS